MSDFHLSWCNLHYVMLTHKEVYTNKYKKRMVNVSFKLSYLASKKSSSDTSIDCPPTNDVAAKSPADITQQVPGSWCLHHWCYHCMAYIVFCLYMYHVQYITDSWCSIFGPYMATGISHSKSQCPDPFQSRNIYKHRAWFRLWLVCDLLFLLNWWDTRCF